MKILDGNELAPFIKQRQAGQVRALRQALHVQPKLAIVQTTDNPVIDAYVRLKQAYGADILIDVDVRKVSEEQLFSTIKELNADESVHGIIIQLPLANPDHTDEAVNLVAPKKDVDGLGEQAILTPATAMAIDWLLAGYNVDLKGKKITIVGNGRLVGLPLSKLWKSSGYDVTVLDRTTKDLAGALKRAAVIVTATGVPSLIKSSMIQPGAAVVDAGTAAEHGKIVGDVAPEVRERNDLTLTPEKGGVGPLTVTALFDNVIQAAQSAAKQQQTS